MILARLWLLSLLLCLPGFPARAEAVRCRLEQGVLIVPAQMAGIAGDFILDTGTARSTLALTQAQAAGFDGDEAAGDGRLAGQRLAPHTFGVADLDVRTSEFTTPIAGVIGADVLKVYVMDIRFQPCWIDLRGSGNRVPPFHGSRILPITWRGGTPAVPAAVSDGPSTRSQDITIATGLDAPMRLSDAAVTPAARDPERLRPFGHQTARLRALSFAGDLYENLPAGLLGPVLGAPEAAVGGDILSHYRLRFDFPHDRLLLAPR